MDDSDRATEQEEMQLAASLTFRKPVLHPNGLCYNCGESVAGIFCDADCRTDWERQKSAEKRSGYG